MQNIALLGATGSIGRSALAVAALHPDRYRIHSIAGGSRVAELVEIARNVHPKHVVIADESKFRDLQEALSCAGLKDVEAHAGAAAAKAGKRLMLANKESVVCGGALLMKTIAENGAELLPVDSEHSAVFQCLAAADEKMKKNARIILTASGGPFRGRRDLSGITPEMAVKHPRWSMGRKISVDSATLMNKGLEIIEASWLFGFPEDRIDVLVHPESIIHSMVEFADGAVMAELGTPDMKTPIAVAMSWPERIASGTERLNLAKLGKLTFEAPDMETFPLIGLARESLRQGGIASIVMNAANEVAVAAFLDRKLSFTGIFDVVTTMTQSFEASAPTSAEEILEVDAEARRRTAEFMAERR